MDHLPYPRNPVYPPICVPYLVRDDFEEIFNTHSFDGLRAARDIRGDLRYETLEAEKLDPFLQEYVFFGFLRSVLLIRGVSFRQSDFHRTFDDGRQVVTTEKLPAYWKRFIQAFYDNNLSWDRVVEERRALNKLCLQAHREIELLKYDIDWSSGDQPPNDQEALYISYTILRETICVVVCLDLSASNIIKLSHPGESTWSTFVRLYKLKRQAQRFEKREFSPESLEAGRPKDEVEEELLNELFDSFGTVSDDFIPFLQSRIDAGNWCPSQLSSLDKSASVLYWLAAASSGNQGDHSDCKGHSCKYWQVDQQGYKTCHTSDCLECGFVGPDPVELARIVRDGRTPVIQVDLEVEKRGVSIRLFDSTTIPEYITISHVWSDGLGNSENNTLPTCQLRRIQKACEDTMAKFDNSYDNKGILASGVAALILPRALPSSRRAKEALQRKIGWQVPPKPVCFWMDTLCVPVKDPIQTASQGPGSSNKHESLRTKAIRNMALIYKHSFKTIVFEASLISGVFDTFERGTRLEMCSWSRRLWTLQEAFMGGNDLCFQTHDGILTKEQMIGDQWRDGPKDLINYLPLDACWLRGGTSETTLMSVMRLSPRIWKIQIALYRNPDRKRRILLNQMLPILAARSTSREEDEAVCIASILEIDPWTILAKQRQSERMTELFRIIGKEDLDPRLLFTPGPRLDIPGFGWAPMTLIRWPFGYDVSIAGPSEFALLLKFYLTPAGLYTKLPCWQVSRPVRPRDGEPFTEWDFMIRKAIGRGPKAAVEAGKEDVDPNAESVTEADQYDYWRCEMSPDKDESGEVPQIPEFEDIPRADIGILWLDPTGDYQFSEGEVVGVLVYVAKDETFQVADGRRIPLVKYIGRIRAITMDEPLLDADGRNEWMEKYAKGEVSKAVPDYLVPEWEAFYNDHCWIVD